MNQRVFKTQNGKDTLYEVQYVVHANTIGEDVYACYRLSSYDGMPIGPLVWIPQSEIIPVDRERIDRVCSKP